MKIECLKDQISNIIEAYAFGIGSLNDEVVNLNIYGVKECDVSILIKYFKDNRLEFKYEESSNKLNKTFIFTVGKEIKSQYTLENNKPKQKLYVCI